MSRSQGLAPVISGGDVFYAVPSRLTFQRRSAIFQS